MLVLTLLTALAAAPFAEPDADHHVDVVERPGELLLFVRGKTPGLVRLAHTTARDPALAPTCAGGGVDVFAPDLADDPWLLEACGRLEEAPPDLPLGPRSRPGQASPGAPAITADDGGLTIDPVMVDHRGRLQAARWPWRALHPVALVFAALLAWCAPRALTPWLLTGLALGVRLAFTPERVLMPGDMSYAAYVGATGLDVGPPSPSPTWTAMLGPLWLALGRPLDLPHGFNLVVGALTVGLVHDLLRRWYGPGAAMAGGLMLALMPLPVAVGRSESLFVLAAALQVVAVLGTTRDDLAGRWLAAASVTLLAHLHPAQVPVAVLLTGWLAWRTYAWAATAAAVVGAATAAGRLVGWLWQTPELATVMNLHALPDLVKPGFVVGPGGSLSVSNPSVTPLAITALALAASWWTPRGQRRLLGIAAGCLAFATVPFVHLPAPTDVARFQLPGQVWLVVLAGAGWKVLSPEARRIWALALVASWVLAAEPMGGRQWTWTAEHDALARAQAFVPDDARVRYRPMVARAAWQPAWLQLHARGVWSPLDDGPLRPGQLRWLGRADVGKPADPCALTPLVVDTIGAHASTDATQQDAVTVGMFRADACGVTPPDNAPLLPGEREPLLGQSPVMSFSAPPEG